MDSDNIDVRIKYRVQGDKIGATRTEVMAEFPFPEDLGRFVSEAIVWNRIGKKYLTRFVNEVIGVAEYQAGGLSDKSRHLQVTNSKAALVCAEELMNSGRRLPGWIAIKTYANYIRHSLHQAVPLGVQFAKAPRKGLFIACYPLGRYLRARDILGSELAACAVEPAAACGKRIADVEGNIRAARE